MQEQYNQYHSPYVGMGNNPISGVDPNGGSSISQAQYWQQGFRSKSWQSKLGEAGIFGYEDARPFLKTQLERFYATMMYDAVRYRNNMTAFDNFWGWYNSRFEISTLEKDLNELAAEQAAKSKAALDVSDAGRSSPSKINAPRTVLQRVLAEPVRPLSSSGFSLVSAAIQEENLNVVNVNMEMPKNVASNSGGSEHNISGGLNFLAGLFGATHGVKGNVLHNDLYWKGKTTGKIYTKNPFTKTKIGWKANSFKASGKAFAGAKTLGTKFGIAGLAITGADIVWGDGLTTSNSLDLIFGATGFIPGVGWAISGTYFVVNTGVMLYSEKSIGEHFDD